MSLTQYLWGAGAPFIRHISRAPLQSKAEADIQPHRIIRFNLRFNRWGIGSYPKIIERRCANSSAIIPSIDRRTFSAT
jgi:hypothetical protein